MTPQHHLPADIERTSLSIITKELDEMGLTPPPETAAVVKRVIHTTADFDYAKNLRFTPGAVEAAVRALHGGVTIVTDTNMALAGISKPGLAKLGCEAVCYMADPAVAEAAKQAGTTRAVAAMHRAAQEHPGAILAVGNAPTALLTIAEELEAGLRPALVIGVPVGFVNVVESKEVLFAACTRCGVPAIAAMGRHLQRTHLFGQRNAGPCRPGLAGIKKEPDRPFRPSGSFFIAFSLFYRAYRSQTAPLSNCCTPVRRRWVSGCSMVRPSNTEGISLRPSMEVIIWQMI